MTTLTHTSEIVDSFGSIAKAHRMAIEACRALKLAAPRYRTIQVLWHKGTPSAAVMQALRDDAP